MIHVAPQRVTPAGHNEIQDHYEPEDERRMYLVMRDLIGGMTLAERANLGKAFDRAVELRTSGRLLTHFQAKVSSLPEYVFMLGSFDETAASSGNDLLAQFVPPARELTPVLRLSMNTSAATPPKNSKARR